MWSEILNSFRDKSLSHQSVGCNASRPISIKQHTTQWVVLSTHLFAVFLNIVSFLKAEHTEYDNQYFCLRIGSVSSLAGASSVAASQKCVIATHSRQLVSDAGKVNTNATLISTDFLKLISKRALIYHWLYSSAQQQWLKSRLYLRQITHRVTSTRV